MRRSLGEKGFVKFFLSLFIIVAVIFVGISFAKPYYRYYTLGSHTRDSLKIEIGNLGEIRKRVLVDAAELNIPLEPSDLSVTTVEKVVKVKAAWTDTVDLWGYYEKKIDFVMEEEY